MKVVNKIIEEGRVAVRNIRRDANDHLKQSEKDHDLSEDNLKRATDNIQEMTDEHINYMLSKIPRNRFAKIEELASLVCWLVSDENSFSTAAVFDLSGGRATY